MKRKSMIAQVKAAGEGDGLKDGQFTAYASVFGNVDSYGDIVDKGAFTDTLKEWGEKDAPIPLLWGHDIFDMFNNIGHLEEAKEDDHGLLVKGQFDLENPNGVQAYKLVKQKRVTDLSFAFDVIDAAEEKKDGDQVVNHLKALKLWEVSVVPIGANPETEFVGVKSALSAALRKVKSEEEGTDTSSEFSEEENEGEEEKDGDLTTTLTGDQVDALKGLHATLGEFLSNLADSGDGDEKADEGEGSNETSEENLKAQERLVRRAKFLNL